LQTRYGNLYFVREEGEDQSILQSLESIKTCLRQGGCRVVPGYHGAVDSHPNHFGGWWAYLWICSSARRQDKFLLGNGLNFLSCGASCLLLA